MISTLIGHAALYIDGQGRRQPRNPARINAISVNTQHRPGSVPDLHDLARADANARTAFNDPCGWARWDLSERATVMCTFAGAFGKRTTRLVGTPVKDA